MREIKFRAWNGKWMLDYAYGDWVSFDGVPYTECERKYDTPNIEIEKAKGYVLMQYTGLLDKNGKEIYEGDIIDFELGDGLDNEKGIVRFSKGGFWTSTDVDLYEELLSEELNDLHGTVVGNIYEHPELLQNEIH